MNIKDLKTIAGERLGKVYEQPELRFVIHTLLRHIADIPPYWYHTEEDYVFSPQVSTALEEAVTLLSEGVPLQYVTGVVEFGDCLISVNPGVLIPRPETENLLRLASGCGGRILDACTGSGCLAVALKSGNPQNEVFACDLSTVALETASENAAVNNAEVTFFYTDITCVARAVEDAFAAGIVPGSLDLLISNPPYVTEKEKVLMKERVLHYEPYMALFVSDDDPLCFYRALSQIGMRLLRKTGRMWLEINESYSIQIKNLLIRDGYNNISVHKDFCDKPRFIEATR